MRTVSFLFLAALLAAACKPNEKAAMDEAWQDRRAAAEKKADGLLAGFDQRLAELRARAESGAANAKEDVRRTMGELEEKKTAVQLKLEDLKLSSKETAHKSAENLENAVDELDHAVKDAASRFH